ncbi:class I SAM-dependent methyltransferase [Nocardioides halotolerans]|jgi:hypothetical protein|uniref:class I SAM-dependent methyltransferase n=1 Tax=Nocardioides halotolerans TaxID=433660 RepID=UPI000421F1F9|nr:methyltransferase domain-containing protein [Nocardioides halotolerans]
MTDDPWPGQQTRRAERRRRFWRMHDFGSGHGLEIGPLDRPMVREERADVSYLDVVSRDALQEHYAEGHGVVVDNIPDIDYVLIQPDGRTLSIADAAAPGAPYDWVVASHVIEHVPDVVGWLTDLAEITVDDGVLALIVPDQRFSFDVHRPLTTVGQMLQAHADGDKRPSVRAVYDHFSATLDYKHLDIWRGNAPTYDTPAHPWWQANDEVQRTLRGEYVDCHVWLFTPESFLRQMRELRRGGHSSWYVEQIVPTRPDDVEFYAIMRRVPRGTEARMDPEAEIVPQLEKPESVLVQDVQQQLAHAKATIEMLEKRVKQQGRRLARQRQVIEERDAELASRRRPLGRLRRSNPGDG